MSINIFKIFFHLKSVRKCVIYMITFNKFILYKDSFIFGAEVLFLGPCLS